MSRTSKADFARDAGVSKAAVSKAVKSHRLIEGPDGDIDMDNPVNAGWLAMKKAGLRGSATVAPRKPKARKIQSQDDEGDPLDDEDDGEDDGLKLRQLKADIEVKEKNAERLDIGNAQKLEELVVRDRMRQRIGILGGEVRTRFLTLPDRFSSEVHALIMSMFDPETFAAKVCDAISAGGGRAEVESLVRAQLGEINPRKIRDLCAAEVTNALKGAKDAAARADLDSFDPT